MNQVVDLSAKLLANEDISVQRANTSTASFDIKSRVLTLPMWKELTPEIEDMLVGHEVGHALYTTEEYGETIKEEPIIKSYLNVLEDVRIEKLIKRKYPGLRKRMAAGYKQLNDRDFFDLDGKDINEMLLIDRINLYFKSTSLINFTPEERAFVQRAERTESIQDVIDLAKEVLEYSREEYEKKMQEMEDEMTAEDSEDEFEDMMEMEGDAEGDEWEDSDWDDGEGDGETDEDGEESEDSKSSVINPTPSPSTESATDPLTSRTDEALAKNLADLADTETEYNYFELLNDPNDPVVSYKTVLEESNKELNDHRTAYPDATKRCEEEFNSFKQNSVQTVNYLVKEFEMRKSATAYKRTQTAKSGSIDMKKIFGYQINDDIFKRVQIVPEGKNHGMMILVDWSGSMYNVIQDTMKQVINLAMFCQRTQIPYRVFAFTTQYYSENNEVREERIKNIRMQRNFAYDNKDKKYLIAAAHNYNLLELFSNKMTSREFNNMARNFTDWRLYQYCRKFSLGSTPLNEALFWVYDNLGKFIGKNNIEKMTLITLTDGEGHQFETSGGYLSDRELVSHGYWDDVNEVRVPEVWKKVKNFYRDPDTQVTYQIPRDNVRQTGMVLKMIKDKYPTVRSVGFYICRNSKRDLYWAIASNTNTERMYIDSKIPDVRKSFRENGFCPLTSTGRDDFFLIPQNSMKIVETDLQANGEMTARKLASQFGKYLNKKKTSRVLLNRFVGWVA